jgi:hypothetical protein
MKGRNRFQKPEVETLLNGNIITIRETNNPNGYIQINADATMMAKQ